MTKLNISSEHRASSICGVFNNVNEMFDKKSTFFDSEKYTEKTKARIQQFRERLPDQESFTEEEIVDYLMKEWIARSETAVVACNYEIGDNGTHHCHLILEDKKAFRFSALQKLYPTIHAELTRGTKEQVLAYLEKSGEHEEKAHTVIVPMKLHGELRASKQGFRSDLSYIQKLIEDGATPEEIMIENLEYRKYSKLIKEHFFQLKLKETPDVKNMTVVWHWGESGSGKSYTQTYLKEKYGRQEVYVWNDYENGGLDLYNAQKILFMDEFKGMPYKEFLKITDVYPTQLHSRYTNTYALWNEIHIASIYTPRTSYNMMVSESLREIDPYQQLRRRISKVIYHFKVVSENGFPIFKTISFTMEDFENHSKEQIEKFAYLFDKWNPEIKKYNFEKDAFDSSMKPLQNKKKKISSKTDQSNTRDSKTEK